MTNRPSEQTNFLLWFTSELERTKQRLGSIRQMAAADRWDVVLGQLGRVTEDISVFTSEICKEEAGPVPASGLSVEERRGQTEFRTKAASQLEAAGFPEAAELVLYIPIDKRKSPAKLLRPVVDRIRNSNYGSV